MGPRHIHNWQSIDFVEQLGKAEMMAKHSLGHEGPLADDTDGQVTSNNFLCPEAQGLRISKCRYV